MGTFLLMVMLTLPDGTTSNYVVDYGLSAEDCMAYVQNYEAQGYKPIQVGVDAVVQKACVLDEGQWD